MKNRYHLYRYVDKKDGLTKYIGITNRPLEERIREHKCRDKWAGTSSWHIEFFNVTGRKLAQSYFLHLIALYATYRWYNTKETDYEILPELTKNPVWQLFMDGDEIFYAPYKNLQVMKNKELEKIDYLITGRFLCLTYGLTKSDIDSLIHSKVLCPLAVTQDGSLLFPVSDEKKIKRLLKEKDFLF